MKEWYNQIEDLRQSVEDGEDARDLFDTGHYAVELLEEAVRERKAFMERIERLEGQSCVHPKRFCECCMAEKVLDND